MPRARPASTATGPDPRAPSGVSCRFDDLREGRGRVGRGLRGLVSAASVDDVLPALEEVEAACGRGLWAAGFVSYEAAPAFDAALPVRAAGGCGVLPLAWFALFEELAPAASLSPAPALAAPGVPGGAGGFVPEIGEPRYAADVAAIRSLIAAGGAYQVNYTTRLHRPFAAPPEDLYAQLGRAQQGGYHALLATDEWAVACGSPELFFRRQGDHVVTRPMKGTAPRGPTPAAAAAAAAALRSSEKERCENVMIVDLLRNDLGRVAAVGSVAVDELFALERYPTVWQMTSTVSCRLAPDVGLPALFGALFPCGSVTGAPKRAAMQAIAALESSPRGAYCGAIGLVGRDVARFAVGIRTAVVDRSAQTAEYGVGSGITWYADATAEWAELQAKAAVLAGLP
jgi:para-aminobenzoate synthetase/4-amino-4-deoxychorismate lyase